MPQVGFDGQSLLDPDPMEEGRALAPTDPTVVKETLRLHHQVTRSASGRLTVAAELVPRTAVTGFKSSNYTVRSLPVGQRAYDTTAILPLTDTGVHDASGVRMVQIGTTLYNHPVAQAEYGLGLLNSFRISGDGRYLQRAKLQAQRLVDKRVESSGAWYFPYPFDFALHGRATEILRAPWYSAMAQGQALSLFVRLAAATNDASWTTAAESTSLSLQQAPTPGQPSVTRVDPEGFVWFDEYPSGGGVVDATHPPTPEVDRTYNGHMFAALGMYDFVLSNDHPDADTVLLGALTTSRHLANLLRDPRWISRYCLKDPEVRSTKYHGIHQEQLILMHGITADGGFAIYADAYRDDYPTSDVAGSVRFSAGKHIGYSFTSTGAVMRSTALSLARTSSAPTDARTRIRGRAIYYRISAGALKGMWVAESYGARTLTGFTSRHDFLVSRKVTMQAGAYSAYEFTAAGAVTGSRSIRLTATSSTQADATAWINGRPHARVIAGALAGKWLPVSSGIRVG